MARGASTAINAVEITEIRGPERTSLKLRVQSYRECVHRPAVSVVGRVVEKLIVEAQPRRGCKSITVVRLKDLLEPRIWQLPVADQDSEPACV